MNFEAKLGKVTCRNDWPIAVAVLLFVFALIFLFVGEPDIHDCIIEMLKQ
jgi:hypothetical protein